MKKGLKLALCGLGLFAFAGFGVGMSVMAQTKQDNLMIVRAEDEEPTEPETPEEPQEPEELPCKVVLEATKHGSVTVSITEGNIGDICVVNAKHDLLYRVDKVIANGVELVESETISGEFSFALIEGENVVSASFVVDEELCGQMTAIVQEATDKDWSRLFTVENAITIVKWLLDGGILIAMLRYYIKDKRLEKKLEEKVQKTIAEIIPDTTKQTVVTTVEKVITPMFSQTKADIIELNKAMNVFAKCMALSQENTPDSRRAILDELSGLKIGDLDTVGEVKKYIEELIAAHTKAYEETLAEIKKIGLKNEGFMAEAKKPEVKLEEPKVVETKEEPKVVETKDNGVQI